MQNLIVYCRKFVDLSIWLGVVVSIVLLPIDRMPYLHHIPFKLGLVSLVLMSIGTLWHLGILAKHKSYQSLKRYLLIGLVLALPVVAYAQSYFYAIDRQYTLGATKFLLAVVLRAFCFFVLVSERPQLWRLIKRVVYIVTAAAVGFAFFQFFFDIFGASQRVTDLRSCCTSNHSTYIFPRVHSTSIEPLYFANFLLIPIWLLIVDMLHSEKLRRSWRHLLLLGASSTIALLIVSRGAILALLAGGFILFWSLRQAKQRKFWLFLLKLWGAVVIFTILLVALAGVASKISPKVAINGANAGVGGNVKIFSSHAVNIIDDSAQTRYKLWPKALTYFKEKPLQCVGAYNSRIRLNINKYHRGYGPTYLQPFNNDFIGLVVDLGLIGLVAFAPLVGLILLAIYRLYKGGWRGEAAAMGLIMVGMLIQSNFFHAILLTRLWVVVGLLLTLYAYPDKTLRKPRVARK